MIIEDTKQGKVIDLSQQSPSPMGIVFSGCHLSTVDDQYKDRSDLDIMFNAGEQGVFFLRLTPKQVSTLAMFFEELDQDGSTLSYRL